MQLTIKKAALLRGSPLAFSTPVENMRLQIEAREKGSQ
jgi:hypothetical protein